MSRSPSIAAVVAAITEAWTGPAAVTDGFRFQSAHAADRDIEVRFAWRRDPERYAVRFPHPGWIEEVLGDEADAADVVRELRFWLMEELDTGFVGRAARRRIGDAVLLLPRPSLHDGWFVGDVPVHVSPAAMLRAAEQMERTGERFAVVSGGGPIAPIAHPGAHLDRDGLDGSTGRAAVEDGSLIAWLQLDRGDGRSPRVGQAVVVRVDATTAAIARLELRTDDGAARDDLVLAACRAAVEAGAERVVADRALHLLVPYGFTERDGRLEAAHDEVRPAR